jgi:hypothetical protein
MENNYCASFRKCEQIGPDDWEMLTRTLHLNENTTIKQVVDWFKTHSKGNVSITITELEKPQP